MIKGKIFDIQRFSVHDGPGIRTTVFMKGCPLRCKWCHNPEGLQVKLQIKYMEEKCISCGNCRVCQNNCHVLNDLHRYNRDNCDACGECVKVCPSEALTVCGMEMVPEKVLQKVMEDIDFYGDDGGVTFSGGEALLQASFVAECLKLCKMKGLHTAVDTCGHIPYEEIEKTLPYCDLYLYDIKAFDSDVHKKYTGVGNELILENLTKLDKEGKEIWIRIPVVNRVNNTTEHMEKIADFIGKLGNVTQVTLMPYHSLGKSKYETLGLESNMDFDGKVSSENLERYKNIFISKGLTIV